MTAARINENNIFAAVTIGSWVLLGVLTLAGYLLGTPRFAAGILAGGVLVLANYFWLQSILKRVLNLQPKEAGSYAQVRYLLRLLAMGILIYVLVVHAGVDVLGLLLGLSVIVVVITALSFYMFFAKGE